ncbi:MAG: delta-60 repeat domain-containing protein [Candidatus Methylomirabilis sp.]|nr:delta-60 repeat domain-containing protein [Candidatus Methylomirabilis sp.]
MAFALVRQPDGKLVATGTSNHNFALARYNPDGSLDTSFGTGGKVVTTFFGGCCGRTVALVLQPDGKLVAASSTLVGFFIDFALARHMPDGTLDLSFGTGGTVTTDFGGTGGVPSALVLQQDGKLVAAGLSSCSPFSSCFALARYNPRWEPGYQP